MIHGLLSKDFKHLTGSGLTKISLVESNFKAKKEEVPMLQNRRSLFRILFFVFFKKQLMTYIVQHQVAHPVRQDY